MALGGRSAWRRENATTWLLEIFPGGSSLPALTLFRVRSLSPHVTGALPAVALVLNSRGGGSAWVRSLCGFFKRSILKIDSFFHCPKLQWFLQPEVMGTYLPGSGNLGCVVWPGAGIPYAPGSPPNFYLPHRNVGLLVLLILHAMLRLCASLPISASSPFFPVWMTVNSLYPWLLDSHIAQFSDGSGWYMFCGLVEDFSVVLWGVKACLPTPSLLEKLHCSIKQYQLGKAAASSGGWLGKISTTA